jgi:hypothetical protein
MKDLTLEAALEDNGSITSRPDPSTPASTPALRILLLSLADACWLLPSLGNGMLWQDETQTALLARTTLRHGLPMGFDGESSAWHPPQLRKPSARISMRSRILAAYPALRNTSETGICGHAIFATKVDSLTPQ